jgi:type I restriction-modification system DNA methylase subunit
LGRQRLFFLEAKKPSVVLDKGSEAEAAAYQTRRYGYSAGLSLSILTDFQEFAVYDTTLRPKPNDKAHVGRILYLKFDEYIERFDEIAAIFSKEACEKGLLHAYAKNKTRFKGTSPLDKDFLSDMESWRLTLAKNLAARNEKLSVEELSRAVQLTIDRILFLRVAEDRGLERYGRLNETLKAKNAYAELKKYFLDADDKYNSGLFHFSNETGRTSEVDTLTPKLDIENKTLSEVITALYPPESPYEFSAITSDILGSAYEQFLGKVITLSAGHRAKVEEKPEVRHAGGVYYTPKYIVDYIVESTLADKLAKTIPRQMKLTILDPACGSGSFLVGAYEYLMRWALDWYVKHDPLKFPQAVFAPNPNDDKPQWRLTIAEKKRLLLNHIFGVDIDANAVEVTKLNLMLKALEDESAATVALAQSKTKDAKTGKLFRERILPDLNENIHCGNSLVGTDYFDALTPNPSPRGRGAQSQPVLFDRATPEEKRKINAFDYEHGFGATQGKFDVIIGNPPYVRQEILGPDFKAYAQRTFQTYASAADLYTYFIEKSLRLLAPKGVYSIIVANKWLRANYGEPLRKFLKAKRIDRIIDFGDLPVFSGATTYPCVVQLSNDNPADFKASIIKSLDFDNLPDAIQQSEFIVALNSLDEKRWALVDQSEAKLLEKISAAGIPLGQYIESKIYRGVLTGLNEAFVIDDKTRIDLIKKDKKSKDVIKPFLEGKDIKRYCANPNRKWLIFIPNGWTKNEGCNSEKTGFDHLQKTYPAIANWLKQFEKPAKARYDQGQYWWELRACDYYDKFEEDKILYQEIATFQSFTIDRSKVYANNKVFFIPTKDLYFLGILNARPTWYFLKSVTTSLQGGALAMQSPQVSQIPIPRIDEENPADVKARNRIIELVEKILALNAETNAGHDKTLAEREIAATDREIDKLVYELYGLTDEEIKIVEGAG